MAVKKIDWTKWIPIVITIITLSAGAVVWAASEHADLTDKMIQSDNFTKSELKQDTKEKYTPRHEFSKVEQKISDQTEIIDDNSDKIDKVDEKIDKLDGKLDTIIERLLH